MRRLKSLLPWIILAVYWLLVFTSTHIPRSYQEKIKGHDITLHLLAYLILTLLYWLTRYHKTRPNGREFKLYGTIILIAAYAAVDELSQILVQRNCSFNDWLSDMAGCALALGFLYILRRRYHWLIAYWICMFIITHWPGVNPLLKLPPFWRQFEVLYTMTGYLILTLLWWRTLCPAKRFIFNKNILLTTLYVLSAYALFDESINLALGHGFNWQDILSGWGGIIVGVLCSATLARHHFPDATPN